MTNLPDADRGTLFDLPFETAQERITRLRASASTGAGSRTVAVAADRPPLRRWRSALGNRLIEVGSALAGDDPVRRRVARG